MRRGIFFALLLAAGAGVGVPALAAQGFEVSGVLDTTVSLSAGAGAGRGFSLGVEEWANVRFSAGAGSAAECCGAVNLAALSGASLEAAAALQAAAEASGAPLPAMLLAAGDYYGAALEIERLFLRLSGEAASADLGLIRAAFGTGLVWNPLDFLNPKNPLMPDARPRSVLGCTAAFYLPGDAQAGLLAIAPRDPLSAGGRGFLGGLSAKARFARGGVEALYGYETPQGDFPRGLHRAGLSLRADALVEICADALYTWDPSREARLDGLSAALGVDYSFLGGYLYVLASYLYNGAASVTAKAQQPLTGLGSRHYLYASGLYRFDDYTSAALAAIVCVDDASFMPLLSASCEVFQGFTLSLQAQAPLDEATLSGSGKRGEFGPLPPGQESGTYFSCRIKARYRF
ncbi:MAG: hypothetical protein LBR16_08065 [Treponema sp.]|jgi:hypothetical protein|nr:hypothetical protein [Treponema sp.]